MNKESSLKRPPGQLLKKGHSIKFPEVEFNLSEIELPEKSVPGNRPFYILRISQPSSSQSTQNIEELRFDSFDSGKSRDFRGVAYRIWTNPSDPKSLFVDMQSPIGVATMEDDGTIVMTMNVGTTILRYPKGHVEYDKVIEHLNGLSPRESKSVWPWPE